MAIILMMDLLVMDGSPAQGLLVDMPVRKQLLEQHRMALILLI